LQGQTSEEPPRELTPAVALQPYSNEFNHLIAQLCATEFQPTLQSNFSLRINNVLTEYQDVFPEPKSLPPKRVYDHKIPLKLGSQPVNIRPYRYHHSQKNAIEKLVSEMLQASTIQISHRPYASPVLLVKKERRLLAFLCGL